MQRVPETLLFCWTAAWPVTFGQMDEQEALLESLRSSVDLEAGLQELLFSVAAALTDDDEERCASTAAA